MIGTMRPGRTRVAMASALAALSMMAGPSRADGLHEETLTIPAVVSVAGRPTTVDLEALVVRPDDEAPHPLAVLNHGSPRNAEDRPGMSPNGMSAQAREFAHMKLAVFFWHVDRDQFAGEQCHETPGEDFIKGFHTVRRRTKPTRWVRN